MMTEVIDKNSGAILFKKSKDTLNTEKAIKELTRSVEELEKLNAKLEKRIKKLEDMLKEDST